ncbi:MAG TPA: DnaJ domain-containing protein [Deltaproteobacteria bacterium]|nr:DnaJ domain-containing protein [Deltaproteobacteria bacterium]HOI05534.1 DnaJ domain-containing protein [Deltaproteobacteria bacterium]
MIRRDYYLVLGVSRSESIEGIKEAFRRLVKRYHPDVAGPLSRWEFQEIVEAYETLSQPERKQSYDRGLAHAEGRDRIVPESHMTGSFRTVRPFVPVTVSPMRDFFSISQSIDSLFDRIFRNFTRMETPRAELPENLTIELILTPEEAMTGGRVPISIPVLYPCPSCRGSGLDWPNECPSCTGSGMVEDEEQVVLQIPGQVRSGTVYEVPLAGLGVHNYYLRVVIRVSSIF